MNKIGKFTNSIFIWSLVIFLLPLKFTLSSLNIISINMPFTFVCMSILICMAVATTSKEIEEYKK